MVYDRNNFMTDLQKVGDQVEYVLGNFPRTRNSDRLLEIKVWEMFYSVIYLRDLLKLKVPTSSSIRRWRRKLNQWGKFLPENSTLKRRTEAEYSYLSTFINRRKRVIYDD